MEMKTNLLIQIILCAALFLSIFFLARSNSEAEKELEPGREKK